ncbi:MAG: hypothetical protein ACQEQF_00305 [Bacillota bacterium]
MPQIATIGNLQSGDLEEILFNDESAVITYTGVRSDPSYFDITLNVSETTSVIQYFVTDCTMDTTFNDYAEGLHLEMDSQESIVYSTHHPSLYKNLFAFKFWSGITGTHTFRIRDNTNINYRNSKHIVLILNI